MNQIVSSFYFSIIQASLLPKTWDLTTWKFLLILCSNCPLVKIENTVPCLTFWYLKRDTQQLDESECFSPSYFSIIQASFLPKIDLQASPYPLVQIFSSKSRKHNTCLISWYSNKYDTQRTDKPKCFLLSCFSIIQSSLLLKIDLQASRSPLPSCLAFSIPQMWYSTNV